MGRTSHGSRENLPVSPSARPLRAVVLDFFGTVARATASIGLGEILARHGYTIPEHLQEMWWSGDIDGHEHVEQSRSRDHYLAWQRERLLAMLHAADVHPGEHQKILDDLEAGRAARVLEAYDEVPGVLDDLRAHGLRLAICSNWDWDLEEAIDAAGLSGMVDVVVSSAWVGARKPHRRMYDAVLERTGVAATDALFVGDTWSCDVEGPRARGLLPVYIRRAHLGPDATAPDDHHEQDVHRATDLRVVLEVAARAS